MRTPVMNGPKRLTLEAGPALAGAINGSQVQPTLEAALAVVRVVHVVSRVLDGLSRWC